MKIGHMLKLDVRVDIKVVFEFYISKVLGLCNIYICIWLTLYYELVLENVIQVDNSNDPIEKEMCVSVSTPSLLKKLHIFINAHPRRTNYSEEQKLVIFRDKLMFQVEKVASKRNSKGQGEGII